MRESKNAFNWNDGTPSIWQRDKELQRLLIAQAWGKVGRTKMLEAKQQVNVYSKAKPSK